MPSDSPPPALSPAAVAAAGGLSLAVAMGIGRFAFTPMLPLMIQEGQLDVAAGGWIAAANYAGYLAGAMSAPRIPLSAKWLAVHALVLTAILTAAMALPGPASVWIVLRFLAGMCSAWAFVGTNVWCLTSLVQLGKGGWTGLVYTGVGLGIAAAGLYCLAAATWASSPGAVWIELGLFAIVLSVPVFAVLRRIRSAAPAAPEPHDVRAPSPPGTTGLVIAYTALGFGYILPATFLPVMAHSVVSDARVFGLAWPVFGITGAVSTLAAGWCIRRWSRLDVWAGSHFVMGVGVLLPSLWLSPFTIGISALFVGGTFLVITMAGVQEIRARAIGDPTALVARMTTAFAAGQIAGPLASSALLHVPALAARGLELALQAGAAALLVSGAWLWREARRAASRERAPLPLGASS